MTESAKLRACPFGFSCRDMFQLPSELSANDCENLKSCKSLSATSGMRSDVSEVYPLQMVNEAGQRETLSMTEEEAAFLMLWYRGATQTIEFGFEVDGLIDTIARHIIDINEVLENEWEGKYIAPEGATVHTYSVYRPSRPELLARGLITSDASLSEIREYQRGFEYDKLTSSEAIFRSALRNDERVKAIHLSRRDTARSIEARKGIERRNRLHQIENRLKAAIAAVSEALDIAQIDD